MVQHGTAWYSTAWLRTAQPNLAWLSPALLSQRVPVPPEPGSLLPALVPLTQGTSLPEFSNTTDSLYPNPVPPTAGAYSTVPRHTLRAQTRALTS